MIVVMMVMHWSIRERTFAEGRRTVPLGGVSRDTVDDDLAHQLVVLVAEEAQGLPCLVAVLVQRLVTVVGNARVRTRVVLHCVEGDTHTQRDRDLPSRRTRGLSLWLFLILIITLLHPVHVDSPLGYEVQKVIVIDSNSNSNSTLMCFDEQPGCNIKQKIYLKL